MNNPARYADPSGHRICEYQCQIKYENADPAYEHYCETCEWDVDEQRKNTKIAETVLYDGTEAVVSILIEPVDYYFTARDCLQGQCSWMAVGAMVIPGISGKTGKLVGESADTILGRLKHIEYRDLLGGIYEFEVMLPSGKRADAVDFVNHVVRELKPDNLRAIQRGWAQVRRYLGELSEDGNTWTAIVDTYIK
jgi:hypothetical protein